MPGGTDKSTGSKISADKAGGVYVNDIGTVKKIDDYERAVVLMDGKKIAIEDILEIDGDIFSALT